LINRPGQTERLGILWTGVDGTGALNAVRSDERRRLGVAHAAPTEVGVPGDLVL
jgi:hypothetical protein